MRVPGYLLHKPTGQARVVIQGRSHYLGKYGTPESREKYERIIGEYLAAGRKALPKAKQGALTVRQLAAVYLQHCEGYYSEGELPGIRAMIKWANETAGGLAVEDLRPSVFEMIRGTMIAAERSRRYINQQMGRLVRMVKWGVSKELVEPDVWQRLRAMAPLKPGRSAAKERPKVKPVDDDDVLAALEKMDDDLAVMVQLQLLTGCRPGELWVMRPGDVERGIVDKSTLQLAESPKTQLGKRFLNAVSEPATSGTWRYRPPTHKNAWREKDRVITIGPMAQELLTPYLLRPEDSLCFTTLTDRQWDRYSYRKAIHAACKLAGVVPWSPYRLRHNAGTEIRKRFGLEAVQASLGHATRAVSEVYADVDDSAAAEVAARIG